MSSTAAPELALVGEPTPGTTPPAVPAPAPVVPAVPAVPAAEPAAEPATLLGGAQKPAPAPAPEPVVPETYAFTLPEGTPLDATATERISATAKALKLTSNEAAQVLADAVHAEVTAHFKALESATAKGGAIYLETVKEFVKSALADPEIGGTREQLDRSIDQSALVLKKFDRDGAFLAFLENTGWGSHPSVIKMLTHIHRELGEDKFITNVLPPAPVKKSHAENIYGAPATPTP